MATNKFLLHCAIFLLVPVLLFFSHVKMAKAEELPDIPKIILRQEWGADEALMDWDPEYPKDADGNFDLQVKKIILHDTASDDLREDSDGTGQYKGMVQDIYRFHIFNAPWEDGSGKRGFGDIGYNYLIDPNGNVYQGRIGGNGVIGAQVFGWNTGTLGISAIGTYGSMNNGKYIAHPFSANLKKSLTQLIGWLAAINGIDLNQQSQFCGKDVNNAQVCKNMYGFVGHRDLAAKQDPGENIYVLFPQIREEAANLAAIYKDYLYQTTGQKEVFIIQDGTKRIFPSYDDFVAKNGKPKRLIVVTNGFSDLFLQKVFNKYADGTLIKTNDASAVYLLDGGLKRKFAVTFDQFKKMGYDLSQVKNVLNSDLLLYQNGLDIQYALDGELVKSSDSPDIYYIENGKKRLITSATLLSVLKLDWSKIQEKPKELLASWLEGDVMRYPDGTLVRERVGPTVYLVRQQNKLSFLSASMFQALGYKWKNILEVDSGDLGFYFDAGPVKWPDGTLIRERGDYKVYQVRNGMRYWIQSEAELKKLGKSMQDAVFVNHDELKYYPLTSLAEISSGESKMTGGDSVSQNSSVTQTPKKQSLAPTSSTPAVSTNSSQIQKLNEEPKIRVAIFSPKNGSQFKIKASGSYDIYGESGLIRSRGGQQESTFQLENSTYLKFTSQDSSTIFEIISYEARPAWNNNINDNKFRGSIEIKYSSKSGKLWVINELKLDDYLKGISEASNDDPFEYQKALMVASRSYALYHVQNGGKYGQDEIFHLKNTSDDQSYKGYGYEIRAANIKRAVDETEGFNAIFQGKPIRAVFSSDSGGTTKSGCKIWGQEFCSDPWYQYLIGGIKDPVGTKHDLGKIRASHGVGLSSVGARRMAETGASWQDILKYYYPGIQIDKIY